MRIPSPIPLILLLVLLSLLSACGATSTTTPCGKRNVSSIILFVYGSDAFVGQFPWHVAVYNNVENRKPEYICDGAIVTRNVVVTAAHCLDDWQRPQQYFFTAGLFDYQNLTGTSNYNVSEIILHPEFNRTTLINDIALLRSDGDIAYTYSTVLPICLPRASAAPEFTVEPVVGKTCLVAGWESPHMIRKSINLQSTMVNTIDANSCKMKIPEQNHFAVDNRTAFCARGRKSYDKICSTNGGGGLFHVYDGLWYLRAIVSLTPRKEYPDGTIGCDPGGVLVFTDVARYTTWIDEHLNQ